MQYKWVKMYNNAANESELEFDVFLLIFILPAIENRGVNLKVNSIRDVPPTWHTYFTITFFIIGFLCV